MTSVRGVLRHKNLDSCLEGLILKRSLGWSLLRGRVNYRLWYYVAAEFTVYGEYFDKNCRRKTTWDECNEYFDKINSRDDFCKLREEYKARVQGGGEK